MMTITLYECDLFHLVQDFYSLSKSLGGGGGLRGIGGALPPVSTTALGVGDSSQPPGNYGAYYSLNVVGAIFAGV